LLFKKLFNSSFIEVTSTVGIDIDEGNIEPFDSNECEEDDIVLYISSYFFAGALTKSLILGTVSVDLKNKNK